ncbi:MAG TPA: PA14 domain-containing protein, partial [Hanamia sp.]
VINNDGPHGMQEISGTIGLKAGMHAISVGYFNQTGGEGLQVSYAGPGVSKQLIPSSALYITNNLLQSNTVNGLNYQYFEASDYSLVPNFSQSTPVKTGTVTNFDISVANRPQEFAINFTGNIKVPSDGQYTFYTSSDDGSNLYIDGVQIVNNDGLHGMQQNSGTVKLQAGMHSISVGYFNQTGDKGLQVSYAGPGIAKQLIPTSVLYLNFTQLRTANASAAAINPFSVIGLDTTNERVANGLDNTELQVGVKAYPNPFTNSILIDMSGAAGNYNLLLVDALGRTIWKGSGNKGAGLYQQSINTSSIQRGIYFLRVIQNNKSAVIKLLK